MTKTLAQTELEDGYAVAYGYYQFGKYRDAIKHFRVLAQLNMREPKVWLGLAASHQMLNEFPDAVSAYAVGAFLNQEDPTPHLHAAECFFAMKDKEEAFSALQTAEKIAKMKPDSEDFLNRVHALRKTWSQK